MGIAVRSRRRPPWAVVGVVFGVTSVSLLLRWAVPINPIGLTAAAFDGGLFEQIAVSLVQHDWLGPFNDRVLAKGPAYPAFIALTYRLNLPLQVAEHVVYLAGAASLAWCVRAVTGRLWPAVFVYAVLAFDPANFSALSAEVTRENLYTPLALLFFSGFFLAVHATINRPRLWLALGYAAGGGASGAAFWLSREEGVWLLPAFPLVGMALLATYAFAVRDTRHTWPSAVEWARLFSRLAVVGVVVGMTFYAPIAVVKAKNQSVYGVALINNFSGGAFPRAYAAWSRVRGVPLRDFVPINKAQRLAVYQVSPAARELRSRLEDPTNGWKKWGCPAESIAAGRGAEHLNICDDFPGGAEPWAIREAAGRAGRFGNERAAQQFFGRLADEIEAACASGKLQCARALPTSLQLVQRADASAVTQSAWHWLRALPGHPSSYVLLSQANLHKMPRAERETVNKAVFGAPRTERGMAERIDQFQKRAWLYRALGRAHHALFRGLLVAAVAAVGVAVFSRHDRKALRKPLTIAAVLMVAVVVRLTMFGVVATTQYFNDMRYQLVTRSFLLASAATAAAALWAAPSARSARSRMATALVRSRFGSGSV